MPFFSRWAPAILSAALALEPTAAAWSDAPKKIVLIGGPKSHAPAEHDFPHGIALFQMLLDASDDLRGLENVAVAAYPSDWPSAEALEGASTLVLYHDGEGVHPLLNADRRAQVERLMADGVGLVTLHQAFTVPEGDTAIDLPAWLGAARYGLPDRAHDTVHFALSAPEHPVSRGVGEIRYYDEFYPTIAFADGLGTVTPILTGEMRVDDAPAGSPTRPTVAAWAFEREGGGRSFGFSGGHFLKAWDEPGLRTLLLNAIFWTAGLDVPAAGVRTAADPNLVATFHPNGGRAPDTAVVTRAADVERIETPWGRIIWYASGEMENSNTMTVGMAIVRPGEANPRHYHPNCDEILYVVRGRIRHTMGDTTVELREGDSVSIPTGVVHNATNIGDEDAVLAISFSSASRVAIGE